MNVLDYLSHTQYHEWCHISNSEKDYPKIEQASTSTDDNHN